MANSQFEKLKNMEVNPVSQGVVQSFDTMSKETSDEKESNSQKQHKVDGPKRKNLGGLNDLDC